LKIACSSRCISGRNSAVECQLPKLDVVGSSPIARSIFLKGPLFSHAIGGSSFRTFWVLILIWGISTVSRAQVDPDLSRPFGQGQVVNLPGTTTYVGDLPHEITVITDPMPFHTLMGLSSPQVGWMAPMAGMPGLRGFAPGLLFEGIPYPFSSQAILNWIPATGNLEWLDFPSAAWWGPETAAGAIQIEVPPFSGHPTSQESAWTGTGGLLGGEGRYQNNFLSMNGDFQHGFMPASPTDTFSALSKIKWNDGDALKIEGGFLGSEWFGHDRWYSLFTAFTLDSPNFQSIQIKPFFQSAQIGSQTVQEFGGYAHYHLNMAGIAESQWGTGWSHQEVQEPGSPENPNKGYVQNSEMFDLLGFGTADMAFRWDFSSISNTTFSTIIGVQCNLDEWALLGDFSKGVAETTSQDLQQTDIGIRLQVEDDWNLLGQYVHEQTGTTPWDGGRIKVCWEREPALFFSLKKIKLELDELALEDLGGPMVFDTGGKLQFSLFPQNLIWVQGRALSSQPFFSEIGANYSFGDSTKLFASVANLDNLAASWPDPLSPAGRVFWLGIEGSL
jgi:hypothetical protein